MHETELIPIKVAEIDKEMVPIVRWLNSYEDVWTLFCCQGNDEDKQPFVFFHCTSLADLYKINALIYDYIRSHPKVMVNGLGCLNYDRIILRSDLWEEHLRFKMYFASTEIRKNFCDYLATRIESKQWQLYRAY